MAYKIIDVIPSERRELEGVIVVELEDGRQFNCGMGVDLKTRAEILLNKHEHIGSMAEVRFFEFYDSGIPRFPVYKGTRLDK